MIGVAIVGSAAVYFFSGGLATSEPEVDSPVPLTIVPLGNGDILVANLGQFDFTDTLYSTDPALTVDCPAIPAGEQGVCNVTGYTNQSTFVLYGPGSASVVLESASVFDPRACDADDTCEYVWTNAMGDGKWEDGRNWGNADRRLYPQTQNHMAVFNGTSTSNCTTNGGLTVGKIYIKSGYTGKITLGGDLEADDSGIYGGQLWIYGGEFDANGYGLDVDQRTIIMGGATLMCRSGNHKFGARDYVNYTRFSLYVDGGTFDGGTGNHTVANAQFKFGNVKLTNGTTEFTSNTWGYTLRFWGGTFDNNNGTIKFTRNGIQTMYNVYKTPISFYNMVVDTGSGNTVQYYLSSGFHLTVENDLTIESGTFSTMETGGGVARDLTVNGTTTVSGTLRTHDSTVSLGSNPGGVIQSYAVQVKNGGLFEAGTGNHTYGALTVYSGGSYTMTNATTTIDSSVQGGFCFRVDVGRTGFDNADGAIRFESSGFGSLMALGNANDNLHNMVVNYPGKTLTTHWQGNLRVDNDLTVEAGELDNAYAGNDKDITVTNDVVIQNTGTIDGNDGTHSFGSLALNAGGTYDATSGTTSIYGTCNFDGTFNHNNGTVTLNWKGINLNHYFANNTFWNLNVAGNIQRMYEDLNVENQLVVTGLFTSISTLRTVTLGNSQQSGSLSGTSSRFRHRSSTIIQAASQAHPVQITSDVMDWNFRYGAQTIKQYRLDNVNVVPATVTGGGADIIVLGDCNFSDLTISAGANLTHTAGKIVVSGNWTNNGNFTHGNGLVEFDSNGYITSGISAFNNVTVSAGTSITLDNATADYTYIAAGANLTIGAGTWYHCNTIAGPGTLKVNGAKTC